MPLQVWRSEEDIGCLVLYDLPFCFLFFWNRVSTELGPGLVASKPQHPPVSTLCSDGGINICAAATTFLPECWATNLGSTPVQQVLQPLNQLSSSCSCPSVRVVPPTSPVLYSPRYLAIVVMLFLFSLQSAKTAWLASAYSRSSLLCFSSTWSCICHYIRIFFFDDIGLHYVAQTVLGLVVCRWKFLSCPSVPG